MPLGRKHMCLQLVYKPAFPKLGPREHKGCMFWFLPEHYTTEWNYQNLIISIKKNIF